MTRAVTLIAVAVGLLAPQAAVAAAKKKASPLHPSAVCGACHGPLRTQWEASGHGSSWTNPVFQAFLAEAKDKHGAGIQDSCLACHAPLAHVTGDRKVASAISKEGITCQFCHSVSAVEPSTRGGTYTFDSKNPTRMHGPYKDAPAPGAHESVFSAIHTKSDFCASCHSYTHPRSGVLIEGTYLAWKRSGGEENDMPCQECHMPPSKGSAATTTKKTRPAVYSHKFLGPRGSAAFLDEAATLTAKRDGARLRFDVENSKAGHSLPGGGNSFRTITLDVVFRGADGTAMQTIQAERFGVEFADADGESPVPKWNAHSIARDTEIGPDSVRTVYCDVPAGAARAEATLTYYPIHPAYRGILERRGVDPSKRAPVVLARATVELR